MGSRASSSGVLTLWACPAPPPEDAGLLYAWDGYAQTGCARSLLACVDERGVELRRRYAAWVHELGRFRAAGRPVVEHLALGDGLSLWWLGSLVERNPWSSPAVGEAIRLLALERIVLAERPRVLRLVGADPRLGEILRGFCDRSGIDFRWERPRPASGLLWRFRRIYRALPQEVQAVGALLRHLWARRRLWGAEKSGWFAGTRSVFFCSDLLHEPPEEAARGRHRSRYWEGLPALMKELGLSGNWLQLYHPGDAPSPAAALEWTRAFNRRREDEGFHVFLSAFLSWPLVLRALKRWRAAARASRRLGDAVKPAFLPAGSALDLWPLLRREWESSTRGAQALLGVLYAELFDAALAELPRQRVGVYLYENQAWERAFIHAWRRRGHGRLIAAAHGAVRFWDLRYFPDPRDLRDGGSCPMPRPDLFAVNGPAALEALAEADFPTELLVEVEALRYGYLSGLRARPARPPRGKGTLRVLVLGDYLPSAARKMLECLEAAAPLVGVPAAYTVRPHPHFPVAASDYPSLRLTLDSGRLADGLPGFDVAYAGATTAAALDARLSGLPVAILRDQEGFDLSPLRGRPGAFFVDGPEALAAALRSAASGTAPDVGEFFRFDPALPRWRALLS